MGASTETASEVLKEFFLPGEREQLNNVNVLMALADKNSEDVEGSKVVSLNHIGRNNGVGYRREDERLPVAKNQKWKRSEYYVYQSYGAGSFSTRLVKSIKTERGGFVKAAQKEMDAIKRDVARNVNFHMWNDSTGVIAALAAATTQNTLQLAAATDLRQSLMLSVDMDIDIGTVANPVAIAENRTITALTRNSSGIVTSITIDGAPVTVTTSHRIFRTGEGGSGADQKVITGVQTSIDDSNVYANIDRDEVFEWQSYVLNVAGPLTEAVIQNVMAQVSIRGGSAPDLFVTTHEILLAIGNSFLGDRRFTNPVELKGGFTGVTIQTPWGNVTITSDRDCPKGMGFFFSTKDMVEYQESDWEFLDDDGSILHLVSGYARYEFYLEKFHELAIIEPRSFAKLTGITTS